MMAQREGQREQLHQKQSGNDEGDDACGGRGSPHVRLVQGARVKPHVRAEDHLDDGRDNIDDEEAEEEALHVWVDSRFVECLSELPMLSRDLALLAGRDRAR